MSSNKYKYNAVNVILKCFYIKKLELQKRKRTAEDAHKIEKKNFY